MQPATAMPWTSQLEATTELLVRRTETVRKQFGATGFINVLTLAQALQANGGATTFINPKGNIPCQPKAGSVLLFTQNLLHEGSHLGGGLKYTLRSEVMFKRP
jgi:hypothetical protein